MNDYKKFIRLMSYDSATGRLTWNDTVSNRVGGCEAGAISGNGYREVCVAGKKYQAHRVAWLLHYGAWPTLHIDHINHERLDNRIVNLRDVTQAENNKNFSARKRSSNVGVTGVSFNKAYGKYVAYIGTIQLGSFRVLWDAICARKSAEYHQGYHMNHGRAA